MAYTSDDLAALEEAITSGVLTVSYAGKTRTFRSIPDLIQAKAHVQAELSGRTGRRQKYSVAVFDDD
jgi:hypothetical protein